MSHEKGDPLPRRMSKVFSRQESNFGENTFSARKLLLPPMQALSQRSADESFQEKALSLFDAYVCADEGVIQGGCYPPQGSPGTS